MKLHRVFGVFRSFTPFGWFFIALVLLKPFEPLNPIALTAIITASVFLSRGIFDKRSIKSLGLRRFKNSGINVASGISMVLISSVIVFLGEWAIGWIKPSNYLQMLFSSGNLQHDLYISLIAALFTAWREELLFRGYMFKNLAWSTNTWISFISSSFLFGLFHIIFNSQLSILTVRDCLGITLEGGLAGLVLAWSFIRTRSLWLPIGIHTGWNFLVGRIFGSGVEHFLGPSFTINIFSAPTVNISVGGILVLGLISLLTLFVTVPKNKYIIESSMKPQG